MTREQRWLHAELKPLGDEPDERLTPHFRNRRRVLLNILTIVEHAQSMEQWRKAQVRPLRRAR